MDEARIGQQGTLTCVRLDRLLPDRTQYRWVYLWVAEPATGSLVDIDHADYYELLQQTNRVWLTLDPDTIKSFYACSWIERALQM
jgi:hypothetical protein